MFAHVNHVMKIGKNNFKPPPAVESSVVRIVPKRPRPEISFEEWDGLLRIVFVRKNRTLRASFLGTTTVMDLLEGNYKTWCAQNNISIEDGLVKEDEEDHVMEGTDENHTNEGLEEDEWEGFMDLDKPPLSALDSKPPKENGKRKRKGHVSELVREKVRRVLEDKTDLADRRARQCDEGDFLRLLWAMNQEGIHFS